MGSQFSPYLKDLWISAVMDLPYLIWLSRNAAFFDGQNYNFNKVNVKLLAALKDSVQMSSHSMFIKYFDLSIIAALGVPTKPRPIQLTDVDGLPLGMKRHINCDGSAMGNPGKAGFGAVAREHFGVFWGVLTVELGVTTAFAAECEAIIEYLSWASHKNWLKV
ncbi:hypothetical protein GIB67_038456 [Kingdonia uniflora]|uniref:RNase H type-1 domain-containing protein n=1 Tax=Kingdonia uniflora TaxID=39325 RepID=A0A7J7NP54_9MAGN|nr:hypothetical protein GIB67_038456 [Kingdonia uniflora]